MILASQAISQVGFDRGRCGSYDNDERLRAKQWWFPKFEDVLTYLQKTVDDLQQLLNKQASVDIGSPKKHIRSAERPATWKIHLQTGTNV